jgi:tRNA (mo5U34)-methyltransferase
MLVPGGELVLETLVIEGGADDVLIPKDRYARMRNVWAIPSVTAAEGWLREAGFGEIQCVDVSQTRVDEQRSTTWMRFESLADSLAGDRTVEGYPRPTRAVFIART